jgi:hypothetical protein
MLLTYNNVCREPANQIEREYCFSDHTVGDWGMFCRETLLMFLDGCSFKIGGPKKTVEIDESKDRTADTLMTIIRDWIEPGATVISDCWGAYNSLGSQGYTHRTVNHSIHFGDPDTGAHTNTIESTWRRVKVFLRQYNRGVDYEFHLAHYTFAARCKARDVPPFIQFLHLILSAEPQNHIVVLLAHFLSL